MLMLSNTYDNVALNFPTQPKKKPRILNTAVEYICGQKSVLYNTPDRPDTDRCHEISKRSGLFF